MNTALEKEILELAPFWKNVSILEIEENKRVLILLCTNENYSTRLHQLLNRNFNLIIEITANKEFVLKIEFIDTGYDILLNTHKTKEEYYPLNWLQKNEVNYITTGIKKDDGTLLWGANYLNLIRPSLN